MPQAVITAPSHTRDAFDVNTLPKIVDKAVALLKEIQPEAILCCGHSGLLVAGAVSYVSSIPVIAVRKPGESNVASSNQVSACLRKGRAQRWVWLDDFISEGRTLRRAVQLAMRDECISGDVPAAVLSYRVSQDYTDMNFDIGEKLGLDGIIPVHCPNYGLNDWGFNL